MYSANQDLLDKETTTRSIDSLEQIRCLCERLNQVCDAHKCLGILPHPSLKKGVTITTTTASAGHSQRPIELGSFLRSGNPANSASQFKKRLTRTQRLGIAVILASSVLQLYQSPWLREIWGKEDIYLSIPELSDDVYLSSIEKISVQRSFFSPAAKAAPSQPACPPTNDFFTSQVINKTLFSLGIILIELCLNRRFEELHPPSDPQSVDTQHSLLYDYKLANCLIEDVYAEGGTEYGYVVQRCLRCEFAGPDSQKRMDIFAFRRMVYQSVLLPLQDDYEKFSVDLGKRH